MIRYLDLLDALGAAMRDATEAEPFALMIVRQSGLRDIERMFGHGVGEIVAMAIGERIREGLRAEDQVVMVGDGDYAVVLPWLRGAQHATLAASKLARLLATPIDAAGMPVRVQAAVGAAVWPQHGPDPEALCLAAEAACARAQRLRERYAMHVPEARQSLVDYGQLYAAIHGGALRVFLQPVVDVASGQLRAFESLARWPAEDGDWVPPSMFVPVAERSGLIDELTRWSLNASLRHCAAWREHAPGVRCSINVSPLTLVSPEFAEQVAAALSVWGVPGDAVTLEVTETAFAEDADSVLDSLSQLRDAGVRIAIDDFGAGYSSFAYLRQFPVDELKIDLGFVRNMADKPRDRDLVGAMIEAAHRIGAKAVAEGVEDARTVELLAQLGCDQMQGYHLGRPRDAEEVIRQLAANPDLLQAWTIAQA